MSKLQTILQTNSPKHKLWVNVIFLFFWAREITLKFIENQPLFWQKIKHQFNCLQINGFECFDNIVESKIGLSINLRLKSCKVLKNGLGDPVFEF